VNYTDHDIELAERYLDGELTPGQKKTVEERMSTDESFSALIRSEQTLIRGVRYSGLRKDLDFLKDLEATLPGVAPERPAGRESGSPAAPAGRQVFMSRYRVPLAAAASVLLLVVAYLSLNTRRTPEELYSAYYEVFQSPGPGITRGSTPEFSVKDQAYAAYDKGNYPRAIELFKQELSVRPEVNDYVKICLGSAYLATGEPELAEEVLREVTSDPHGDMVTIGKWYLALSHLKQGELEEAKSLLIGLSSAGKSPTAVKAGRLLEDLD
jgi:tetratricopeptide (TPR) repeat protein